jgi:hypothetical protein
MAAAFYRNILLKHMLQFWFAGSGCVDAGLAAFDWPSRWARLMGRGGAKSVPVAQLDRALASGAKGCGFESRRGRFLKQGIVGGKR